MTPQSIDPLEVFISYSHQDEGLREALNRHLRTLVHACFITTWHDRRINLGEEWDQAIDKHLDSADIILLLTSSDFIASDYCYEKEIRRAMVRHDADEARVIPVILRACGWQVAPFGRLQALPTDGIPVMQWPDRDAAFLDIHNGIQRVVEEIRMKRVEKERTEKPSNPDPGAVIPHLRVPFVSRRDQSGNDIVKLIQDELAPDRPRQVALCGAGGVGKTAIAAEAVLGLIERFENRIVWVSADGLEGFSLATLLDGIAHQLGKPHLREHRFEKKEEQVRCLVKTYPTLVVLDKFETIEASERAHCVNWLANSAPCSALITSRDVIEGPRNFPIEAMRPEEAHNLLNQLITEAHDERAFTNLDRGRVIQTAEANPLILQWIVGQIDLAQDPDEVLDDLRNGEGSAAERVFDRAFRLEQLGEDSCATLLALSLFAQNASQDALAEVAGFGEDLGRLKEVWKRLASLWLVNPVGEGSRRLTVTGLTRELARVRLSESGQGDQYQRRFIGYFLRFIDAHRKATVENYAELEAETDNLLLATLVTLSRDDWNSANRFLELFAHPVYGVWTIHDYWENAIRLIEALKAPRWGVKFDENMAMMLYELGRRARYLQKLELACQLYYESLEIRRGLGDPSSIAKALDRLAKPTKEMGELDKARRLYEESLEIKRTLGVPSRIARALDRLAKLLKEMGELDEARRLYDESLAISEGPRDQRIDIASGPLDSLGGPDDNSSAAEMPQPSSGRVEDKSSGFVIVRTFEPRRSKRKKR